MNEHAQRLLYTLISFLVSGFFHLSLWKVASHVMLPAFDQPKSPEVRNFEIDLIDMKIIPRSDQSSTAVPEALLSEQNNLLEELFVKDHSIELPQSSLKPFRKGMGKFLIRPSSQGHKKKNSPATRPKRNFNTLKTEKLLLKPFKNDPNKIPKIQPQELTFRPQSLPKRKFPSSLKLDQNLGPKSIARIPSRPAEAKKTPRSSKNIIPDFTMPETEISQEPITILDSTLSTNVMVYRDPQTGEGFFQIEITLNDGDDELVPKDILMLQDASSSITFSKLEEFKKGIKIGLGMVNKQDRYNIVAFREQPKSLFPYFVKPTQENLSKTNKFLDKLSASGKTDLYAGLAPFVSLARANPNRPCIILLISDGRTTSGFKLKDRELIRRIFQENSSNISIFSFSVGRKANLFLMDFLSYKNRGFSEHVEKKENSSELLGEYIFKLSELAVADLYYKTTGNMEAEIYPKELPHLFRLHPLTLYGKIASGVDEIAVQIIGKDQYGKKEELVTRLNFINASRAGPELAYRWAMQKIYHLLGESILNDSQMLDEEINKLALKYNINVPY